jgi:hypothetical protein
MVKKVLILMATAGLAALVVNELPAIRRELNILRM